MHALLIFKCDFADDFDVVGFRLLNETDYNNYKEFIDNNPKYLNTERTWFFGSNEELEFRYFGHLTVIEISEDVFNNITELFNIRWGTFGHFPPLMDDVAEYFYHKERNDDYYNTLSDSTDVV